MQPLFMIVSFCVINMYVEYLEAHVSGQGLILPTVLQMQGLP
jgi:hypothetical protein